MKKYHIQSRVCTGTEIFPKYNGYENDIEKRVDCSFEYDGIHLRQWDFTFAQGTFGDAWILSDEILANNAIEAISLYLKKLARALPRIFFAVPVWHSFGFHEPLLISNDGFKTSFYFMRKDSKGVGLTITPEIEAIIKDQGFQNIPDKFFLYYSEFINANTALSGLSLGLAALEIIRPQNNKDRIDLLGVELFYKIYGKVDKNFPERKEGIRHRIHHGKYPEEGDSIERDFEDMNLAIKVCLLQMNPAIEKIFELRNNFASIPRQKTVKEGYNGIYLEARAGEYLDLKTLVNSDTTVFYDFQNKLRNDYGIEVDINQKIENY